MRELQLLQHIYGHNAALPDTVTIPPGDDMGAIRIGEEEVLITVDQVADGVHFALPETPLEKVGRKAITRNLSDVAAMAALPVAAVVAASLPRSMSTEQASALFDAMRHTAAAFDCPLVGGDISIWDKPLLISVTLLARCADRPPVRRSGARAGDVICVTGRLGGSLEAMADNAGQVNIHHLDFEPRIAVARALATDHDLKLHSMIDLSDGLASDLRHICNASHVGAELWADALPVSAAAHRAAHRNQVEPWRHALSDGEDYELCFTVDPVEADRNLPARVLDVPITRVGVITEPQDQPSLALKYPDGRIETLLETGWVHQ